jgi:hypothetical protein
MKELSRFSDLPLVGNTGERHAWGAFGAGDEIGTVNLLGAAQVKQGGKLVRTGKVINLSLPLNLPNYAVRHADPAWLQASYRDEPRRP